jgi:hypothetical protein
MQVFEYVAQLDTALHEVQRVLTAFMTHAHYPITKSSYETRS